MRTRFRRPAAAPALAVVMLVAAWAAPGRPLFAGGGDAPPASGRVHYRLTGPIMNGTAVLAWIDHGRKFRQDTKMAIGSTARKSQIETWSIGDGTYLYTYQPAAGKQVMRVKLSKGAGGIGLASASPFAGQAGTRVGRAVVLGKACEIRVINQGRPGESRVWVWNGVPLRTEAALSPGSKMTMEATRIDAAPKLSPVLFQVPAGYQVRDFQPPPGRPRSPALPPR